MWPARLDWNKNMIFRFLGLPAGTVITTCGWCGPSAAQDNVILKATPKTGATVDIETLITSSPKRLEAAGVVPEHVEQSLRDIYDQVKDKGPGGHILTGPIFV